jgi:hypothetical protein
VPPLPRPNDDGPHYVSIVLERRPSDAQLLCLLLNRPRCSPWLDVVVIVHGPGCKQGGCLSSCCGG